MDISLIQFMRERIEYTSTTFHRYLYNRLDWGRQMLGLVGPRGVGKTTMFLQYIGSITNRVGNHREPR